MFRIANEVDTVKVEGSHMVLFPIGWVRIEEWLRWSYKAISE